jgi:putative membrane-bound dehydrogenase-like protein
MTKVLHPSTGSFRNGAGLLLFGFLCTLAGIARGQDEAYLFTPPGFAKEGKAIIARGEQTSRLRIVVRDARSGKPTGCRINVVGADGNYYQPKENDLTPYSLTGQWPKSGLGNREGKGPFRYYGRFFYSRGETIVEVPAGPVRIEAWKGFEFRPEARETKVVAGAEQTIELTLTAPVFMPERHYYSGDPHLHFKRESAKDDDVILDLMDAEDIHFGSVLAFNEPPGPYAGFMTKMAAPQLRGLGKASLRQRGVYAIQSGQEYRTTTYGHLNLFLRDDLVRSGQNLNANDWPVYGHIGRETQKRGGLAFYAHGGYAQAIYADFAQGDVNGVELLQFGEYRGIGLEDWYRILNIGYRFPCTGASDYPACRTLGDCRTYVYLSAKPDFESWLRGAAAGRSFVTTGPLLFLDVDGNEPGATVAKNSPGLHRVRAHVRVRSEVAPVTHLQLIVNGTVEKELQFPAAKGKGQWLELDQRVNVSRSSWIAARAFSQSPSGKPDAEAHTNPVYVYLNARPPYDERSLDALRARLEKQIVTQAARSFPEKSRVLDYFQDSRALLRKIRIAGGLPAGGVAALAKLPASEPSFDPSKRSHSDEELRTFLKLTPPKPPEEALKTFETAPGFRMELVAQEPLVHSPVAGAFDENGNLYVAEMIDYPYLPKSGKKPQGTIRLLEDTDGDGVFDKSHVFAEGLYGVSGIAPWKGGIFVIAPPDIWYLKDTHGDHRADVRRKVYTGFGFQNPQGMANNLIIGLDHKIYGTASHNGGIIRSPDDPQAPGIDINHRDFRFDPVNGDFETVTGTAQFGNAFDDWGNRFLCNESHPLIHVVLPQHYLARNPYLPVPRALNDIAGGSVPIYRSSPLERWREIRSSRRIREGERPSTAAGASHYVVDAGAGLTIYRGGAYPPEYYGHVFTPDAQSNLIHHRALLPDGATFKSKRVEEKSEFVRSSDNWFRPVNALNAPDGTLYVLDMSREILEAIHIPLDVLKFLDLRSGRDHGRIYRIAPVQFTYPGPPQLGKADGETLVKALESPHGWWRDTAHRLIYERQDQSLAAPLRRLLRNSPLAQARLHALWSLEGLGALAASDLADALRDPSPGVREQAVRLAEPRLNHASTLLEQVLAMAGDPEPRIGFQLAFSLGEVKDPRAASTLARVAAKHVDDPWIRTAVLSSVSTTADRLLVSLLEYRAVAGAEVGADLLGQLAAIVGVRQRGDEIERVLDALAARATPAVRQRVVRSLGDGLKRSGGRLSILDDSAEPAAKMIVEILKSARMRAEDSKLPELQRCEATRLLSCAPYERSQHTLEHLLDPGQPEQVQIAAVRALADYDRLEIAGILLARWPQYAPGVRSAVVEALLAREPWTIQFLQAASSGQASVQQVEPVRREVLLKHRNPTLAALARKAFGSEALNARKEVIADYMAALRLKANAELGHEVFRRSCMTCHRIGSEGSDVGPNLTGSSFRDPGALLVQILDPNQYVLPKYVQYMAADRSGRTFTGIIANETATSITLRRDKGAEDTILRSNLDELVSTGKSLMPEGLEKQVNKQEMAHLLLYLIEAQAKSAPLDRGTKPDVLVEPE